MTILGRFFRRDITYQQMFANGDDVAEWENGTTTPKKASGLIPFMSAVRLLTDDIATLPIGVFVKRDGQAVALPHPDWLDVPMPRNPNLTRAAHVSQIMAGLLFDGNAFILALPDVFAPAELRVLNPMAMEVKEGGDGTPIYTLNGRSRATFGPEQIVHVPLVTVPGQLRGLSFLEEARQAISSGVAMEEFAGRFFRRGATPSATIQMPAGVKLTEDQAKDIAERFEARHSGSAKSHRVAVIDQGGELKPWSVTPEQAQFIETRLANVEDCARLFRIPPPMLGINAPGAVSYASVEQQSINYVIHTIRPYLERIEQAYNRLLPTRIEGQRPYIKLNVAGLLRGDLKSRYDAYSVGMQAGFLTADDIRRLEDMPGLPGGDRQRVPLTHADAGAADLKQRIDNAAKLVQYGWEPAAAAALAGLPSIPHTGLAPVTVQPQGE